MSDNLVSRFTRREVLAGCGALFLLPAWPDLLAAQNVRRTRLYANCRYGQMFFQSAEPANGADADQPPLVCLHKSPSSSLDYLEFQMAMASDRLVLCPDTPGYGASDAPASLPEISDYSLALADALVAMGYGDGGKGPVDVLGFHTGSFIAAELAVLRPELVRRLVIPGVPYFEPVQRKEMLVRYGKPRPFFEDPDYVGTSYRTQVIDGPAEVPIERRHEIFVGQLRSGVKSYYGLSAVFLYDADQRLAAIKQPALLPVLNETLDDATRHAAAMIENAQTLERADLDGLAWITQADEMANMVRSFLNQPSAKQTMAATAPSAGAADTPAAPAGGMDSNGIRHWRHFSSNRYGQLHFTSAAPTASNAPPVVLLHQSPLSAVIFEELIPALASDRIVHAADTPGFGDSDGPVAQPTMSEYGAATAEALRDLGYGPDGLGPVDVFGFHTGSFVASELARQAPDLVRRVILCGVPYYPVDERLARQQQYLRPYAFFTDPDYVDRMYKRLVSNGDENTPELRRLQRFTDRMRAGPNGEWGPRAVFAYDADTGLAAISQPTLLMAFEEVMTEPTIAARAFMPGAEYQQLKGLEMMGFMSDPERVAGAIREFLDSE